MEEWSVAKMFKDTTNEIKEKWMLVSSSPSMVGFVSVITKAGQAEASTPCTPTTRRDTYRHLTHRSARRSSPRLFPTTLATPGIGVSMRVPKPRCALYD
jgi:hypothetical protein